MAEVQRAPYDPHKEPQDWLATYLMLCGHCEKQTGCAVIEAMIEMKSGGTWPEGGWVTDPGAGVTCLSYQPSTRNRPLPRQQIRAILRTKEEALPPVCGGCAALKGSEASVSLHTQRDYADAVRRRAGFACHEDPNLRRPCGGWCRAIQRRAN